MIDTLKGVGIDWGKEHIAICGGYGCSNVAIGTLLSDKKGKKTLMNICRECTDKLKDKSE